MSSDTIVRLPELIDALPATLRTISDRLFCVERAHGSLIPPPAMHDWIVSHFGDLERVQNQTVVKVTNRLTLESAFYSPLRAHRPQEREPRGHPKSTPDQALESVIAANIDAHDMFRDPLNQTPTDPFGRIQGQYCVSASNVAKCDGWHGLVIFAEPHPLRFNRDQLHDYFDVALRWVAAAHQADAQARYPLIVWNGLWKGGASITHGHMQMLLSREMACGQVERWRRAANDYRLHDDRHLMQDVWQLHNTLGLTFTTDSSALGYVTLTPVKDREVVLQSYLSDEAYDGETPDITKMRTALAPLWELTHTTLRNLIDEQGVRSFNVAVYLPPCGPTTESWADLPVTVRIVDRGDPLVRTVSIGAMEMFASSIITVDPFHIAEHLRLS